MSGSEVLCSSSVLDATEKMQRLETVQIRCFRTMDNSSKLQTLTENFRACKGQAHSLMIGTAKFLSLPAMVFSLHCWAGEVLLRVDPS